MSSLCLRGNHSNISLIQQRQDYLRATFVSGPNSELIVMPFNRQDSAMMACFASADCLIVRSPFAQAIKKGELVNVLRLNFSRVSF